MSFIKKIKRFLYPLESKIRNLILGRHPYNTIFNYNWVNVHRMVKTFKSLGGIFHGRVADLGSGASPYYDLISPNIKSYIAIDLRSGFPQREKRAILRVVGNLEEIPLSTDSVDAVFCSQVLSQIEQPTKVLCEIKRILRVGGYAVISVPHVSPLHSEPKDLYRFTPEGLGWITRSAGLKVRDVHTQGQLFASFALCLSMNLVLSQIVTGQPMKVLFWRQLFFAPLIGFINAVAYLMDMVIPFSRTPVNFILVARKG